MRTRGWMPCLVLGALLPLAAPGLTQDGKGDKEQLRRKLKDTEVRGAWIYDDLESAFAVARKTAKPLLVVFRCVP